MHLRLTCQLGSAPTAGRFFHCWLFEMIKPSPFPCTRRMVHRTDAISSPHSAQLYWIFITIQRFYKFHFSPSSLATPISKPHLIQNQPHQVSKWTFGLDPGASWVTSISLHHLKSQSEPPPPLLPQVGSDCGWLEDELITCLTAQLTAHLAELSLAELNLSSSNIILSCFPLGRFEASLLPMHSSCVWKSGFADFWPFGRPWCSSRIGQTSLLPFPCMWKTNSDPYRQGAPGWLCSPSPGFSWADSVPLSKRPE